MAPCLYFLNKFYHQHKITNLKQFRPSICFLCMSKVGRLNLVPPNQRMPWTQMNRAAICSQEGASPPPAAHICCSKRGKQTCNLQSYETTHSQGQNVLVSNMNYYQNHDADKKASRVLQLNSLYQGSVVPLSMSLETGEVRNYISKWGVPSTDVTQ